MLKNTLYKLTVKKKLTVGYFGGSITEGAGASNAERTSYRALVSEYLAREFPDAEITSVQAAIGGTGSDLGAFRCDRDLISYDPDLVFFEYAVNDSGAAYGEILANTEGIFRKIFAHDPCTDIVVIHTTTAGIVKDLESGSEYRSRTAHSAVAHYYGDIVQIDVGEVLRTETAKAGGDWSVYTGDTVHPNDAGYKIYADVICERLRGLLTGTAAELIARELPPIMSGDDRAGAYLLDSYELELSDLWKRVDSTLCSRYPHYIESDDPNAELTFSFVGSRFGLYWMLAKDSGDIVYSVDGGKEKKARSWDTYCQSFNRAGGAMLENKLPYGRHSVTIRVSSEKAELSTGHMIRIGAIMIN